MCEILKQHKSKTKNKTIIDCCIIQIINDKGNTLAKLVYKTGLECNFLKNKML